MKRNFYLIAIVALLIFIWNTGLWAEDKIGFINLKEVLRNSSTGQKSIKSLEKLTEKEGKQIKATEKALLKMKEELEKDSAEMTANEKSEKVFEYRKKLREYELQISDADESIKRQDNEITQKMLPDILKIIQSIAEKEKYTMVLDVATANYPYYDKKNDISEKVIKEFNKKK
jgi:outer membrane protein